jgi:Secretion system C-terminal sorting domain
MKTLLFAITSLISLNYYCQAPTIQWQKGMAGSQQDVTNETIVTTDGGYISIGDAYSTDLDFSTSHGNGDGWVNKYDVNGITQWSRILGGSSLDNLLSITQTSDGGYIVVGRTYSNDGDVSGFHTHMNTTDGWVVKLNSSGVIQWQKCLGGTGSDLCRSVLATANGGCIIAGSTTSLDGDVSTNHGTGNTSDYWVVNLDANGTIIWEKIYGGSAEDQTFSISKTSDGGYAVAGMAMSSDGDVTVHNGPSFAFNCWIIKINATGVLQWNTSFLLSSYTAPSCIKETTNHGFIISGRSGMAGSLSTFDALVIKLDSAGTLQWYKSLGGTLQDDFYSVIELSNSEYLLAGTTSSSDGDITNYLGGMSDCWLMKIDATGNIIWKKTYGGSGDDGLSNIQKTNDNSYIASGFSSSIDNDVTTNLNNSSYNPWIIKFNPLSVGVQENQLTNTIISIYPNPANDIVHINTSTSLVNESYAIINTLGQTVLNGKLENDNTNINVQTLQSGIYFLQIGSKQTQSYKIIKN